MTEIIKPKKLIESSIPLDAINKEAAREKSIRHGHPSTLHLWWARRPLATCRAILFAQMVNDPGWNNPNPTPQQIGMYGNQRAKLFRIIRDLVKWENSNNPQILKRARDEIWKSWVETCEANKDHPNAGTLFNPDVLPGGHDPFAGGGAIPLEMQRLGLTAYASDLNPVAVMINKAMIEIPPKCAGHAPINPGSKKIGSSWKGCEGLAEDIEYYGRWMREEAFKRIGHLYPKVKITEEMAKDRSDLCPYVGQELTVIAWIWARTVKSPNPAYNNINVPLISSYWLSKKKGHETYFEPEVNGFQYTFNIKTGLPKNRTIVDEGTKTSGKGANFRCIFSGTLIDGDYIKAEGQAGRIGNKLLALVLDGDTRIYVSVNKEFENIIIPPNHRVHPNVPLPEKALGFNVQLYGMHMWNQLYTARQLLALSTFSDLLQDLKIDLLNHSSCDEDYARAIITYLAFAIDKCSDRWSSLCGWDATRDSVRNTFGRQAIPITWDYVESNPFSSSTGNWNNMIDWIWKVVKEFLASSPGFAVQADAQTQTISQNKVVSTDPPYYDNIGYACLSDYFYYWLRQSLKSEYPDVFSTITVPKEAELIAEPARHESKQAASDFFLHGMTLAMTQLSNLSHPAFPVTIYYAFKQEELKNGGMVSTGWETFIEAVIQSGFSITGTWPMRTELGNRMRGNDANALASSIVLVCRKRDTSAPQISRKEFIKELNTRLPKDLALMTGVVFDEKIDYKVSAVDLAQSAIGPGMGIYSKYSGVIEANGSKMTVHDALLLINKVLSAYLDQDDNELDADTKFCKAWFEQYGWTEGKYGEADVLARAKGTSVDGLQEAGVLQSGGGKVRLLRFTEYPNDWDPETDSRLPVWEALHHLIKAHQEGGDAKAGKLFGQIEAMAQSINLLTTRLYQICDQKGWAEDARYYNELTASWQNIDERADRNQAKAREPSKKKEVGQKTLEGFSLPFKLPLTFGTLEKSDKK